MSNSLWLARVTSQVRRPGCAVVVEAALDYGFLYVARYASSRHPGTIWLHFEPGQISESNGVAQILYKAIGVDSQHEGPAPSLAECVRLLRAQLQVLSEPTLILTGAEYVQNLATAIFSCVLPHVAVIVHFEVIPQSIELPPKYTSLAASSLRLSFDEALDLSDGNESQVMKALELSGGAYERFVSQFAVLSLSEKTKASITPIDIDHHRVLRSLITAGDVAVAFMYAARHIPDAIAKVVNKAGDILMGRGDYEELWRVLDETPAYMANVEEVVYWRYSAALATNRHRELMGEVKEFLRSHSAARLRALFAISNPSDELVIETQRAYESVRCSITARALGFAHSVMGDPVTGARYLMEGVRFAVKEQNQNLHVAALTELASAFQLQGRYPDALQRAFQAQNQFRLYNFNEELRRLYIASEIAYSALLLGRLQVAEEALAGIDFDSAQSGIPSLEGLFATLSDFCLAKGDTSSAVIHARRNVETVPSSLSAYGTLQLVRAYLGSGLDDEARRAAEDGYQTVSPRIHVERFRADLALGMAYRIADSDRAIELLNRAQQGFSRCLIAPHLAQASIILAGIHLRRGEANEAKNALLRGKSSLTHLSHDGWQLLGSYTEEARLSWELWVTRSESLYMQFLGERTIRLDQAQKRYSTRSSEILAVLAWHPEGLSGARLATLLYAEVEDLTTIKSNLSRLRRDIDIGSRPYQIKTPFRADFLEFHRALESGRIREALELYQGSLLPESTAPFVVELRDYLEESLRQAVLTSKDPELVVGLGRKLPEDLELWERLSELVDEGDPLHHISVAHIRRIEKTWQSKDSADLRSAVRAKFTMS